MTTPSIQIDISPTGETKLQTSGFEGRHCQEASRFLEQALGDRTAETLTSEYYQIPSEQQQSQHLETPS